MRCSICGSEHMVFLETITFSNGKTYDIYKCTECGFIKRVPVRQ